MESLPPRWILCVGAAGTAGVLGQEEQGGGGLRPWLAGEQSSEGYWAAREWTVDDELFLHPSEHPLLRLELFLRQAPHLLLPLHV